MINVILSSGCFPQGQAFASLMIADCGRRSVAPSLTPVTDTLECGAWTQLAIGTLPSPWGLTQGPGCCLLTPGFPSFHPECSCYAKDLL